MSLLLLIEPVNKVSQSLRTDLQQNAAKHRPRSADLEKSVEAHSNNEAHVLLFTQADVSVRIHPELIRIPTFSDSASGNFGALPDLTGQMLNS